jgi:hypothetical protein
MLIPSTPSSIPLSALGRTFTSPALFSHRAAVVPVYDAYDGARWATALGKAHLVEENCGRSQETTKEERTRGESKPEPTLKASTDTTTIWSDDTQALTQITGHLVQKKITAHHGREQTQHEQPV